MHSRKNSTQCSHMTCSNDADIKKISKVLFIILMFMFLELWGHWKTNSLSLLADSLHLLVDILGFIVSLLSLSWAKKPSSKRMTFGYHRIEIIGSLVSIGLIWAAVGYLAIESFHKYLHPSEIDGGMFFTIAVVGFFVNCICVYVLHYDEYQHKLKHKNLNIRATYVHVVGDLIQSVGVIIAGMVTYFYPSKAIVDVVCTMFFSILVLVSTGFVLKDGVRILAEGAPTDLDIDGMRADILEVENVYKIVDLYAWSISMNRSAVSIKVLADEILISDYENILMEVNHILKAKYLVDIVIIQIDTPNSFYRDRGFVVDGVMIDLKALETPGMMIPEA
ncbi:putative inorganic ion transport protein [Encephalitozoon hellem ATCC 50504]|uniref:Cation diffusion facilitator family transporter n=1 Tax=Encephalitozoon hellem TaxID=27973 RepID=A0A9Q9FAM4_ENCHE|nr:putative inorganic ion transport protein [Encephalitozoon hellem ATCC 50504]AFM99413.1 putative inorganic ion transport protein [Encephalitozoon hellem ATCC 50504]UTX44422.1 cation diffusion facilitator family transporter [Encephalitozoon hellem]WEL39923.1 cation diffusion facilitator family transporter [Encephalitozoon hellem]|eukprot:XP_003888394.1 putative inorganic ion transport protein [Encephalitozoon hellem ATCC 50504]